ncbi:hypothetical protein F0562_005842 [Nyssa sinensis]|uniref:Uncharacterized protein n=1 Tax=Nyssa sinensis TaxID=561372 RepID=A0A5J5AJF4_9ASTE|nr:hypothetical protein F0562_005842 [Nyssa sinensis]
MPRLHTDSSCSEHVVSPEFMCEVQSEPKWDDFEKVLDYQFNYMNAFPDDPFAPQVQFPEEPARTMAGHVHAHPKALLDVGYKIVGPKYFYNIVVDTPDTCSILLVDRTVEDRRSSKSY